MMAIRDTMRRNAAPLLKSGEEIQAVISAQTVNPLFYPPLLLMAIVPVLAILFIAKPFRVIVVTNRRILVCQSGKLRTAEVHEVLATYPRKSELGMPRGLQYKCTALGETPLYVQRRFFPDVFEADQLRPGAA